MDEIIFDPEDAAHIVSPGRVVVKEDDFEPKGRKCGALRPKGPEHVKCRLPKGHPGSEHWYYENMCCGVPIYESTWR